MTEMQTSPLGIACHPTQVGDNAWAVEIQVATPLNFYAMKIPVENVDEFAENLATALRDAAIECRKLAEKANPALEDLE